MTIGPQAGTLRTSFLLGELISPRILGRLLLRVFLIPPGEADRELYEVGFKRFGTPFCSAVRVCDHDLSNDALVAVGLVLLDIDFLSEQGSRHGLLRVLP